MLHLKWRLQHFSHCLVAFFFLAVAACEHHSHHATLLAEHQQEKALKHSRLTPLQSPGSLGAGDVIDIRVYGENELSGTYQLSPEGHIELPLIGEIHLLGLAPQEASSHLTEKLRFYLKHPYVSIFLKEQHSQKIYILGEIKNPGTYPFQVGMTIIQAITMAGGFAKLARANDIIITRQIENGKKVRLKAAAKAIGKGLEDNIPLQPGDIVFVPEIYF